MKTIKMRAFRIGKNNISNDINLFDFISQKLEETTANERRMVLNQQDEQKEEDLICFYEKPNSSVFGMLLRIRNSDNVPNIPDDVLEQNKFKLEDLPNFEFDTTVLYKDHYYFLVKDNYLIVTLRGNVTIKHFQTYTNWLIEEERKNTLFEFTPIVKEVPEFPLNELKSIKFEDPARKEEDSYEQTETKKLSINFLQSILKDVISLDEVKLSEIVSAELLLKFRKPKTMTSEEYQNYFGALLKPTSDLENITLYPKKGKPIKGSDIEEMKEVKIETTEKGTISEKQLKQEMEKYLNELQNEFG